MSTAARHVIDWSVIESIAPGNREVETRLLALFVEDAQKSREALAQGMQRGDLDAVSFSAHELSGAARSLGASSLADAARTLENAARTKSSCEQPWHEVQQAVSAVLALLESRLAEARAH